MNKLRMTYQQMNDDSKHEIVGMFFVSATNDNGLKIESYSAGQLGTVFDGVWRVWLEGQELPTVVDRYDMVDVLVEDESDLEARRRRMDEEEAQELINQFLDVPDIAASFELVSEGVGDSLATLAASAPDDETEEQEVHAFIALAADARDENEMTFADDYAEYPDDYFDDEDDDGDAPVGCLECASHNTEFFTDEDGGHISCLSCGAVTHIPPAYDDDGDDDDDDDDGTDYTDDDEFTYDGNEDDGIEDDDQEVYDVGFSDGRIGGIGNALNYLKRQVSTTDKGFMSDEQRIQQEYLDELIVGMEAEFVYTHRPPHPARR